MLCMKKIFSNRFFQICSSRKEWWLCDAVPGFFSRGEKEKAGLLRSGTKNTFLYLQPSFRFVIWYIMVYIDSYHGEGGIMATQIQIAVYSYIRIFNNSNTSTMVIWNCEFVKKFKICIVYIKIAASTDSEKG